MRFIYTGAGAAARCKLLHLCIMRLMAAEMIVDNSQPCMKNIDVKEKKQTARLQTREPFERLMPGHYSVFVAYRVLLL